MRKINKNSDKAKLEYIFRMFDDISKTIENSFGLMDHHWVNGQSVNNILKKIHNELPEALEIALKILKDKDIIITDTNNDADRILKEAQNDAERIRNNAKNEADSLIKTTKDHCDNMLAKTKEQCEAEIEKAEKRCAELVDETYVKNKAEGLAAEILKNANDNANDIIDNAEDYVAGVFEKMDGAFSEVQKDFDNVVNGFAMFSDHFGKTQERLINSLEANKVAAEEPAKPEENNYSEEYSQEEYYDEDYSREENREEDEYSSYI
ncbi:MAG: hypothetical protein KBT47_09565 [Armatimonadetes bacterium]|nr:hypothetical protein [Candidatus Hippobium faecium]